MLEYHQDLHDGDEREFVPGEDCTDLVIFDVVAIVVLCEHNYIIVTVLKTHPMLSAVRRVNVVTLCSTRSTSCLSTNALIYRPMRFADSTARKAAACKGSCVPIPVDIARVVLAVVHAQNSMPCRRLSFARHRAHIVFI